jgi:hypothetical protein
MPMNVRPRRSATIRTRLDFEGVRQRLHGFASDGTPDGVDRFLANGYFMGGWVGAREFHLEYRFNSAKNPQTYDVAGTIRDTPDWRIIRLKITAHSPWMGWWGLVVVILYAAFSVYTGEIPAQGVVVVVGLALAFAAFANLLYIPDVVTNRVSALLAGALRGSVLQQGRWVVPPAP